MEPPTEEEKELLIKLRSQVEDVLTTDMQKSDHYLIRWLRAKTNDLQKAEQMIRNTIKVRKELGIDDLLSTPMDPWFSKTYPFWVEAKDKVGRPVLELPIFSWDIRKALEKGKEKEYVLHVWRMFETALVKINEANEVKVKEGLWPDTQVVIIQDWDGYPYSQLLSIKAVQGILKMAEIYDAHYSGILHTAFYINCPPTMPTFLEMLKRVINQKTLKRIVSYTSEEEWGTVLQDKIEEGQLAHIYGGDRVLRIHGRRFSYAT